MLNMTSMEVVNNNAKLRSQRVTVYRRIRIAKAVAKSIATIVFIGLFIYLMGR